MIFDDLTPPPGGLAGLRRKLDRPRQTWAPVYGLAAAACALIVLVWPATPPPLDVPLMLASPATGTLSGAGDTIVQAVRDDGKVAIYLATKLRP